MKIERITRNDIKSLEDLKIIKKEGKNFPTFVESKVKKLFKGKILVYVEKMQGVKNNKISYYYNYWVYCIPCSECEGWYRIVSDYEIDTPTLKSLIYFKIFKNYTF